MGTAQVPLATEPQDQCAQHEQVLAGGGSPAEVRTALMNVARCGGEVWGRAIARGASRLRHSADTTELGRFWRVTGWLLDARILEVAQDVAADPSATVPARVHALRTLLMLGRPDLSPEYGELTAPPSPHRRRDIGCHFGGRIGGFPYEGAPLPHDARARIVATAELVRSDPSQPADVRQAARCVDSLVRLRLVTGS